MNMGVLMTTVGVIICGVIVLAVTLFLFPFVYFYFKKAFDDAIELYYNYLNWLEEKFGG